MAYHAAEGAGVFVSQPAVEMFVSPAGHEFALGGCPGLRGDSRRHDLRVGTREFFAAPQIPWELWRDLLTARRDLPAIVEAGEIIHLG
jgi:hypothetical protein